MRLIQKLTSQTTYETVSPRFNFRPVELLLKRTAICTCGKLLTSE